MILLEIDTQEIDVFNRAKKLVEMIYEVDDISKKSRKGQYLKARRMFIYEMYWKNNCTLKRLGHELGELDHSSILHQRDKFHDELVIYPDVKANYNQFKEMLYGRVD